MRVILDSNVWVSALLFRGLPRQLLILATQNQIEIFSSSMLLDELEEVLQYPKLQKRITRLETTAAELLITVNQLINLCPLIEIEPVPELRDKDDLIVLSAAISAQALVIVSGDKDLLVLEKYAGIQIVTVADFLSQYFPNEYRSPQ
jgi:putative PIN family toxin of toxin-antitoxin system